MMRHQQQVVVRDASGLEEIAAAAAEAEAEGGDAAAAPHP